MDIGEWMGQLAGDELAHIEDWLTTGEQEVRDPRAKATGLEKRLAQRKLLTSGLVPLEQSRRTSSSVTG